MEPPSKQSVSGIETMILAFGQLIQPADADQIYDFSKGTLVAKSFTREEFHKRFRWLERQGFFWRTFEHKYVVTPKGESLASKSLNPKARDKIRLLILNKERYSR